MGDLNARVGLQVTDADPDFRSQPSETVGPWSLKNGIILNENGGLLLDIATENQLWHVGSHLSCRDSKRWTWKHPRYGTRAVLDHIFCFIYTCMICLSLLSGTSDCCFI